jgi:hypothetical protein
MSVECFQRSSRLFFASFAVESFLVRVLQLRQNQKLLTAKDAKVSQRTQKESRHPSEVDGVAGVLARRRSGARTGSAY